MAACNPFVTSDNLLVLALVARNFSQRPSTLLEIPNPATAMDFDVCAALRLLYHDRTMEKLNQLQLANRIAEAMAVLFAGAATGTQPEIL